MFSQHSEILTHNQTHQNTNVVKGFLQTPHDPPLPPVPGRLVGVAVPAGHVHVARGDKAGLRVEEEPVWAVRCGVGRSGL